MFILKKPWNLFSSSSRPRYKWLNITNTDLFMFIGCTHMFCLLRRHLLLHIIVCKTSMLQFSIALEFFTCALLKSAKNPLGLTWTWLDSTRSVCKPLDSRFWLDWTGLDLTLLCWCVRTLTDTLNCTWDCACFGQKLYRKSKHTFRVQ
jgi:hypothetical protein